MTHTERWLVLLIFSATFFFTEIAYQTSNYTSRLFLTQAIVDQGTFSLNAFEGRLGVDHAVYAGDYFSDKPPGSSLLMLPAYFFLAKPIDFVVRMISGVALPEQTVGWLVQLASLALLTALGMVALYRILGCLQVQRRSSFTFLCFFGTLMFPFSTIGTGEMYTVPLVLGGLYLFVKGIQNRDSVVLLYSGLCWGLGMITTYQTALFIGVLGLFLLSRPDRITTLRYFVPPILLAGLLLLGYHWLLFDDPLASPVNYWAAGNPPTLQYEWPTLRKLAEMLLLPWKGIFFYSPFLLFGVLGYGHMAHTQSRPWAALFAGCFGAYFLFLAFNVGWYGGSEYGFRYIIPALPFLCISAAVWLDARKLGILEWALIVISLLLCGLGAITDPHVLTTGKNPIVEYTLPYLRSLGTNNVINHWLYEQEIVVWWIRMLTTLLFMASWVAVYLWWRRARVEVRSA